MTDTRDSGPAPSIVSLADILSGKIDLDDAFDQDDEETVTEDNAEESSNVSYIPLCRLIFQQAERSTNTVSILGRNP